MRELLRTWLGRHLAAILIVKLAALVALWAAFFSAPVPVNKHAVARARRAR
ncbi:MAG: cytochrome oxidase putative small subunit CydP [Pseudomonadota bacterium]